MAEFLEFFDMAGDGDGAAPKLSESSMVPTIHVSGVLATDDGQIIRFVFWDNITDPEGNADNRVVERLAMTRQAAHGLMTQLQGIFATGH